MIARYYQIGKKHVANIHQHFHSDNHAYYFINGFRIRG